MSSSMSHLALALHRQTGLPMEECMLKITRLAAHIRDEAVRAAGGAPRPASMETGGAPRAARPPAGPAVRLPPTAAGEIAGSGSHVRRIADQIREEMARPPRAMSEKPATPKLRGPSMAEAARELARSTGKSHEEAMQIVAAAAGKARRAAKGGR
jgi:hypothetical protein